jgi:hypothetical protein
MGVDPDKKMKKIQKERSGVYQSNHHPEHFPNEGEEYLESQPRPQSSDDDLQKNSDVETSKGRG